MTTTAQREDFQQLWSDLPQAFRRTHPLPLGGDRGSLTEWVRATRKDSENAAVAILDAATIDLARGDREAGNSIAAQARPFRRLMTYLATCDPHAHPCDECGARPAQPCQNTCHA